MPSLYAQYIAERESFSILETDKGFATYRTSSHICYLRDIFVLPEYRKEHYATFLADMVTRIAKELGCTILRGSVDCQTNNWNASCQVLEAYGMHVVEAGPYHAFYEKEI